MIDSRGFYYNALRFLPWNTEPLHDERKAFLFMVPYHLKTRNPYKITFCLSVSLSVKSLISGVLGDIEFKFEPYRQIYVLIIFWQKAYFYIYLKKDMIVYIIKNSYFDTIKRIKINRMLSVPPRITKFGSYHLQIVLIQEKIWTLYISGSIIK